MAKRKAKPAPKKKPAPKTPAEKRKKKIVRVPERKKAATAKRKPAPKKKPPTGRPPYRKNEKDERIIKAMIGSGDSERVVAMVIGIARNTMRKHYADHLDLARFEMLSSIKQTIYREALKGNPTLLIWVSKTQLGWQEPPREHRLGGSADAPPIQQVAVVGNIDTTKPEANDPVDLAAFYAQALEAASTVH